MKRNVGRTDQIIRVILGVVIILVGIYFKSWWGVLGLVPLVTGIIGYCPLYALIKVSTYKGK